MGIEKLVNKGTSPPHQPKNDFTCGCAFEHIATLVRPPPSYQWPKWKSILACVMK